jgi:hypothetical protein
LLLVINVDAATSYSAYWWKLTMMGVGMGLTMTPMTAAVMSAVPGDQAGMASAIVNTSRQTGGTLGIAVLGAIVTNRFSSSLVSALHRLHVPPGARSAILAGAARPGAAGGRLSPGVDAAALHHAVGQAFTSGMHSGLAVGGAALLAGAVIALLFVRPPRPATSQEAPRPLAAAAS